MHLLRGKQEKQLHKIKKRLRAFVDLPTNRTCSDCPESNPSWASLLVAPTSANADKQNPLVGVLCCYRCYSYHLELGKDVCCTKNILKPDEWTVEEVEIMERGGGNDVVNFFYEASLSTIVYDKQVLLADMDADAAARREFVRNKYQHLRYFDAEEFQTRIVERWTPQPAAAASVSAKPTHAMSKRSQSHEGTVRTTGVGSLPKPTHKKPVRRRSMNFREVGDEEDDEDDARTGYNLPGHLGVKSSSKLLGGSSSNRGRKSPNNKDKRAAASTERKRRSLSSQRRRSSSNASKGSTSSSSSMPSADDLGYGSVDDMSGRLSMDDSSRPSMDMSSSSSSRKPSLGGSRRSSMDASESMGASSSRSPKGQDASAKRRLSRRRGSTEISQLGSMRGSMKGSSATTTDPGDNNNSNNNNMDESKQMGASSSSLSTSKPAMDGSEATASPSSKRRPSRQRGSAELSQLGSMRGSMKGSAGTANAADGSSMEESQQMGMSSSRWGNRSRPSLHASKTLDASDTSQLSRMQSSQQQQMDATARRSNRRRRSLGMNSSTGRLSPPTTATGKASARSLGMNSSTSRLPPPTTANVKASSRCLGMNNSTGRLSPPTTATGKASSAHVMNRKPKRTMSIEKPRQSTASQRLAAAQGEAAVKGSSAPRKPSRYCSSGEDSDVVIRRPDAPKRRPTVTEPATSGNSRRRKSMPSIGMNLKNDNDEEDSITCQYSRKKYTGIDVYSPHVRRGSLGLSNCPKNENGRTAYGMKVAYGFDGSKSSDSEQEKKAKRRSSPSAECSSALTLGIEAPALGCYLKSTKEQPKKILDERSLGSGTKSSNEEILGIGPTGKRKKARRRKSMGDVSESSGSQLSSQSSQRRTPENQSLADSSMTGDDSESQKRKRRGSTGSGSGTLSSHLDPSKHTQSRSSDGQSIGGLSGLSFGSRSSGFESRSSEDDIVDFSGRRRTVTDRLSASARRSLDWARHYTVSTDDEESVREKQFGLQPLSELGYKSEDQVEELLSIAKKMSRETPSNAWASEFKVEDPKPDVPSRDELGYDNDEPQHEETMAKSESERKPRVCNDSDNSDYSDDSDDSDADDQGASGTPNHTEEEEEDLGDESVHGRAGYAMPQHARRELTPPPVGEPMDASMDHAALRRRSSSCDASSQSNSMASFKTAQQGSSLGSMAGSGVVGHTRSLSASFKSAQQGSSVLSSRGSLLRQDSASSVASDASEMSLNASLLQSRYPKTVKGEEPPAMIPMAADESSSSAESFNRSSRSDSSTTRQPNRELWRSALGQIANQHSVPSSLWGVDD